LFSPVELVVLCRIGASAPVKKPGRCCGGGAHPGIKSVGLWREKAPRAWRFTGGAAAALHLDGVAGRGGAWRRVDGDLWREAPMVGATAAPNTNGSRDSRSQHSFRRPAYWCQLLL